MMISSSVLLILMSFVLSLDILWRIYVIYLVWCRFVIIYLANLGASSSVGDFSFDGLFRIFLYVFFMLSTPLSFSLFYKLSVSYCVFSCGFFVLLRWVIYRFSEQFYLIKYLVRRSLPKDKLDYVSVV